MDVTDKPAAGSIKLDYQPKRAGPPRGRALQRALSLVTIAWMFGVVWATAVSGTPQTNFAKSLHASEFQFGLLTALPFIASLFNLPASMIVEATGKRKLIFLIGLYVNRVMWFPIALVPLWIVRHYGAGATASAMSAFLILMFIMHLGQGFGGPGWGSWMADIVPERVRGKYFSRKRQWSILTAVPAGLAVGWLLDHYALRGGPDRMLLWCAGIFIVAAPFGIIDIHLFHYVPDVPTRPQKGMALLRAMRQPLHNRQFMLMAGFTATLIFAVSFMGQFVTKYVMEQMGGGSAVNLTTQMMLIVVPSLAVLSVITVWGRAGDRMGKKPLLVLASLGLVPVGAGWCFLTAGNPWLGYVLAAAGAALYAGVEVANWNLVMEFSNSRGDESSGSAFSAVNTVIISLAGALSGLASGAIAEWLRDWHWQTSFKTFTYYDVLFGLSALLRLLAVVIFLPYIHEENARPTRETLRFMTANIYNNLFSAIQLPLKVLRFGGSEGTRAKPAIRTSKSE